MKNSIIVQKFGGTSVSTHENRLHCVKHIKNEISLGHKLVVVVSAMGRKGDAYATDTLLSLLSNPNAVSNKERDLLLSTGEIISATSFSSLLNSMNISSVAITGSEAGIITDENFNNANIVSFDGSYILELLKTHNVVVVAGFQGKTKNGSVTTLGRGGSDTSATALGVGLKAERVDIFTDVEGIYTADPRIVSDASPLSTIRYDEICNLAHLGAKVIHPRPVELAMTGNIPLRVRSTFSENEGTLITNISNRFDSSINEKLITGITSTDNLSHITVYNNSSTTYPYEVFKLLKDSNISLDLINVGLENCSFTINKNDKDLAQNILSNSFPNSFSINDGFAKISLVGANIAGVPGVMASILETLLDDDIKVFQSADSHTTIWILIEEVHKNLCIQLLHKKFNLSTNLKQKN